MSSGHHRYEQLLWEFQGFEHEKEVSRLFMFM